MNHSPRTNVVTTFTGVDGTNVYRSSEGTYHIRPVKVGVPFASDVDEVCVPKVVPLFTDEERAARVAAFFDAPPSLPPRRIGAK